MYLQIAESEIETVWNALERLGAVERNGALVHVVNWDKRQFETDAKDPTSKNRKTKWKQEHNKARTKRNAAERCGTPESETNTYTDKKDIAPSARENDFDIFYKAYPKKRAPKEAKKAYLKAVKDGAEHSDIMAGLDRAKRTDPRFRDAQFTPYAASWLNAGCFDDEKTPPEETEKNEEFMRSRGFEYVDGKWLKREAAA
jgi:hypothetical protein